MKHKIPLVSMQGATWNPSNVLHLRGRGCQDTGANLDPFGDKSTATRGGVKIKNHRIN